MDGLDIMGYDRAITVFSPDGRLLQVEYARKTVSQGSTAIGIACKEGVVFVADKRILDKLMVPESLDKIFKVDDHIGATMSGLISDGRVLIAKAQIKAQSHRIAYNEEIPIMELVRYVADYKQMYTQYAGARPFGVSLLIGGIDDKRPRIFVTEPSGIFFEYYATSIGEGAEVVNKMLEKKYKFDMKLKDAVKLGLDALKEALGEKFNPEKVDIAVIPVDGKFKKLHFSEVKGMA